MKKYSIVFASLIAALIIGVSPGTVKAQVNNDMVLGFLMGFAQNNTVQSGNFIGALTGTALGGSVNSTGGTVTNIGNVVGSGGLTGGLLGGALSGSLNATGINGLQAINTGGANPISSIGTGFLLGQTMAGLNTNLASQGLSLASIAPMTIPGLNGITGGVGTNTSIGAIVSSLMGQSATANAITGLMNGGLLGNTLSGVTGGIQAGGANLLLNSLGLGSSTGNMGLSSVGQMAMASILSGNSGIAGLSGMTGLTSLNLLNAGNSGGLLGSLLSGGSSLTSGGLSSLLSGLGTGGLFGSTGALTNPSSLFGNGQSMMQNASAVAQNLLGGNFLGAAIQNAIGSAVGSALGQTVNNALGSGLSNMLGMATGALSTIGQALTGALGSLGSALGGLFGGSNPANTAANAASNAITNATNSFSNSLAGMLNCNSGTPSTTGTNPTTPTNPGTNVTGNTNIPTDCGQITFNHRSLGTVSINPSAADAQQQFARVMTDHNNGDTCNPPPQLLARIAAVQAQVAQSCSNGQCSAINVTSTYRSPERQAQIRRNAGCHPTQGSCPGIAAAGSSQHNQCNAMDLRFNGVSAQCTLTAARAVANREGTGGVGYYGSSGHVHVDVGRRRDWGGGGSTCHNGHCH